jgi:hypothetical protein
VDLLVSTPAIDPASTNPAGGIYRILFAVLIALLFGKALLLAGGGQPLLETDMTTYWKLGSQFAKGDWLQRELAFAQWPPGYPLFLGSVQAAFGRYAMIALPVVQLFLDFGVALLTAWICAKVSGSRAGALLGLGFSFCCMSRSCFAVYAMADNLLCVAFVLYFAVLVRWLHRPSVLAAAAVGASVAIAVLVKSVAQPLIVTTLALMAYKLRRSMPIRSLWPHAAAMLAVTITLLAPWFIRNKLVFGHFCLAQFTGRALWDTCRVSPRQLPVENADGPNNRRLRSLLEDSGINMDSADTTWPITYALREKGYSDYDADKIIQAAAVESIIDHPAQYLAGRPIRFAWFWVTPKPFFVVPWGSFYAARELPLGSVATAGKNAAINPPGQTTWTVPFWRAASNAYLRVVWHPNSIVFGLAALASAIGCVVMIRDITMREVGLAAASILLVVSLSTTFFGWPQYRFRLPLEPIMIVAVSAPLLYIWRRYAARQSCMANLPQVINV